ncbi:Zinc metalloprotease [Granulibacter bethesdensis]|uniref:M48 family metallopeptidase n=1 Tax=Granulibacter bethesdensis TaxID=364410 RepID=UPI00090AD6EE|nr:SprT family zinc-dependent metalloprotease [Granulibacter bethesdensis]APH57873.1 Zinc metalloprotease [Granulibacter bethesdensis]
MRLPLFRTKPAGPVVAPERLDASSAAIIVTETLPGGLPVPVLWRRNVRARRISLRIDARRGHAVLTLPGRVGRKAGLELLYRHAEWVEEKLAMLPPPLLFQNGATIPFDGREVVICHDGQARGVVRLEGETLHVSGDPAFLKRRVQDWLRREAQQRFSTLTLAKAASVGLKPRRVSIKDTVSRWGSCAPDGSIAYSWRLIMAPPYVQDYVAGHETAHLKHMNHSADFWALCVQLTPYRAQATVWLRQEGGRLMRVGAG